VNKRTAHHYWRKSRLLKPWYFLILAAAFGIICVFALRSNYQHMVTLRNDVYTADKNNGNVTAALNNLRSYVYAHMNTSLATSDGVYPPIQLQYTYDRLVQAESAQVSATNQQLYTQAQAYCQQQDPVDFSGRNRVPCIENFVNSHGVKIQTIPDSLYKFDFVTPKWSPDLAGWSIVLAVVSVLLAVLLFVVQRWVRS
jgi:hypothetical protein